MNGADLWPIGSLALFGSLGCDWSLLALAAAVAVAVAAVAEPVEPANR